MDGRRAPETTSQDIRSPRMVWQLFSPSFRLIACTVSKSAAGYTMRVTCGGDLLAFCEAPHLEDLHARAADWRAQLESHGYVVSTAVSPPAQPQVNRRSEARTGLIGLVECSALVSLRDPAAGRELRDRATEGLVAVGLGDVVLLRHTLAACRAALDHIPADVDLDLTRSCMALLDRVEASLGAPVSREVS